MASSGYIFVILAAAFWGISGVVAKWLFLHNIATPVTVSQTRVLVGWLTFLVICIVRSPRSLRVSPQHVWRFALLGIVGVAGANFGLYFAISRMDAAVADVIQFTAPTMVAVWLWARGEEAFDIRKLTALILTGVGVAFSLGVGAQHSEVSLLGAISAFASALSYAFLMIWGKRLSKHHDQIVFLHYAMLSAFLGWCFIQSPIKLLEDLGQGGFARLIAFGMLSVVAPYLCFFAGLKRVPATGAGIVSTLEPVVMALGAWQCLGEQLSTVQWIGIFLVIAGVVIIQIPRRESDFPSLDSAANASLTCCVQVRQQGEQQAEPLELAKPDTLRQPNR